MFRHVVLFTAGYIAYRDHTVHRQMVERYVTPIVASRAAIQFEA